MIWPNTSELASHKSVATKAAEMLRLPLRNDSWRGTSGNWQGGGIGNSIDFQDHRPYFPGDDPRHINWSAYARTGNYSMKLYREEVSPRVDILFDCSDSMSFVPSKRQRAFELLYFCVESALQAGASLNCHTSNDHTFTSWPLELVEAGKEPDPNQMSHARGLTDFPWRADSLRIWITDLLFPVEPEQMLVGMGSGRGFGVVFSVYCNEESSPDWDGNI